MGVVPIPTKHVQNGFGANQTLFQAGYLVEQSIIIVFRGSG